MWATSDIVNVAKVKKVGITSFLMDSGATIGAYILVGAIIGSSTYLILKYVLGLW